MGHGRNAQLFKDSGMNVSGIEISQTAINLAQKHFGKSLHIYHGSVTEMPFEKKLYDGIYCKVRSFTDDLLEIRSGNFINFNISQSYCIHIGYPAGEVCQVACNSPGS